MSGSAEAVRAPKAGWAVHPAIGEALQLDRTERGAPETVAAMVNALYVTGSRDQDWAITHMSMLTLRGVADCLAIEYLGRDDLPVHQYSPRALRLIVYRVLKGRRDDERAAAEEVVADA